MMKLKNLYIAFLLVTMMFMFSTTNNVYAESNYVPIYVEETETSYNISSYFEANVDTDFSLKIVIDDLVCGFYESFLIDKDSSSHQVYVFVDFADENIQDVKSAVVTLKALDLTTEAGSILSESAIRILKYALPAIMLIAGIMWYIAYYNKKKLSPINSVINEGKALQKQIKAMQNVLRANELPQVKLDKLFNKFIKKAKRNTNILISRVIPLNIESMGQHNTVLTKLFELDNILNAIKNSTLTKTSKEQEDIINSLAQVYLPNVIISAEDIKTVFEKQEHANDSKFIQHSSARKDFGTKDNCDKFVKQNIFNKK